MKRLFGAAYSARIEIGGLEKPIYDSAYSDSIKAELERKLKWEIRNECLNCHVCHVEFNSHEVDHSLSRIYSAKARCGATYRCVEDIELSPLSIHEHRHHDGGTTIFFDEALPRDNFPPKSKSLIEREKELFEAVEYETNQKNYDNFGSW